MKIMLDGQKIEPANGANYAQVIRSAMPDRFRGVLGVAEGGQAIPLTDAPCDGDDVRTLTFLDSEGRRIYERTLRFVFLLAAKRLFPDVKVRIENSAGRGVFARLSPIEPSPEVARRIEAEMRAVVQEDLPFAFQRLSRAEAIDYFDSIGREDAVRLLKMRGFDYFPMYECGGMMDYFYGEMAPSTGYVPVFELKHNPPGVMLMLPDKFDSNHAAKYHEQPKLMATFAESARWSHILGCTNVADLNEMIARRELREFIRVNEALHEKSVSEAAKKFAESGAQLILIAGPSSSGKTTFTHRLSIALRVLGLRPVKLSLDDYYLNRDLIPTDENGERDFERLDTLDVALFNDHLVRLLAGDTVETPTFDFRRGMRTEERRTLRVAADQPIIVEGIHALNEQLTDQVPDDRKFKIYISALTMLNLDDHNRIRTTDARLVRRLVRDHLFRGTSPEQTLSMWRSVRRGEDLYIFPYQEHADLMFNSTLVYELAILKRYAYALLSSIGEESPYYTLARRLIKFLNYVHTANVEDEVPGNSILREFIGGCCFYREE